MHFAGRGRAAFFEMKNFKSKLAFSEIAELFRRRRRHLPTSLFFPVPKKKKKKKKGTLSSKMPANLKTLLKLVILFCIIGARHPRRRRHPPENEGKAAAENGKYFRMFIYLAYIRKERFLRREKANRLVWDSRRKLAIFQTVVCIVITSGSVIVLPLPLPFRNGREVKRL